MDKATAIRLAMGAQALAFSRANPSADPNLTALVTRLQLKDERGRELGQQALSGELSVDATVRSKEEIAKLIRGNLMALSGVAQLASLEAPGIEALIRVPRAGGAQRKLITATRVMLATVTEKADLFRRHGLPENFVPDLTALVDEFEGALGSKESGTQSHVGANAELDAVAAEIIKIVNALDRLNRVRFRNDPEKLAAWKHARDVAWPVEKPEGGKPAEPAA